MDGECITLCSALEQKYRPEDFATENFESITISPRRRAAMLKMQHHEKRKTLALDMCNITNAGDPGEIRQTCPLLEELDLSHNAIQDWKEVFSIMEGLDNLCFLNLSHNPLADSKVPENIERSTIPRLKHLIINNIRLDFPNLVNLLKLLPSIEELHASLNSFCDIPECDSIFDNVKSLHFSKNNITTWDDVQNLGKHFPCLQTLIIAENEIEEISDCGEDVGKSFQFLEKLSIANTKISKWECLDKLLTFPALHDVRMQGLPVWSNHSNDKERVQLIIARLPNLKTINGGEVHENEREDAERAFLRYYKEYEEKPGRFEEIYKKYGELDALADVNMRKSDQIIVSFNGDIPKETFLMFDLSLTTSQFRKRVSEHFCIPLSKFRLIVKDETFGGVEMKYGTRTLLRYTETYVKYHENEVVKIELQRLDVQD